MVRPEGLYVACVALMAFATSAQAILVAEVGQGMDPTMSLMSLVPLALFAAAAAWRARPV